MRPKGRSAPPEEEKPQTAKPRTAKPRAAAKPRTSKSETTVYGEWHYRMGAARANWIEDYMGVWGNMQHGWEYDGLPKYLKGDPEPDGLTADAKHFWWLEQARQHLAAHGGSDQEWSQDPDGYKAFRDLCPEPGLPPCRG